MSFDPYRPYGTPVETTVRVATWNVWGRYGDWEARQEALETELAAAGPDVVCLVESWSAGGRNQAERVAGALGLADWRWVGDWEQDGWTSGIGLASRWPVTAEESRALPGDGGGPGSALHVEIGGPRGPLHVFAAVLDYPLHASANRQAQVAQLCEFVAGAGRRHVTVVCGDFNAGPDSDEIRMLTGASPGPVPGLVFYDAWEVAGDGGPGITWSNRNPLAAVARYPDRRFDYVLSAWPRAGAAGHPVRCELLGVRAGDDPVQVSDHYGVVADLRY